ncbi:Protein Y45F3A.8 [Aphelenchoides avenae]|nr:Protein Y45F3A.8 [Aphelenchus avenae]
MYAGLMTAQCAKTCGHCPKEYVCEDSKAADCKGVAYMCENKVYRTLMTDQCPKTCGRCEEARRLKQAETTTKKPVTRCADNHFMCGIFKLAGFCRNFYYTMAQRKYFCGHTCNMC